ncbi:Uncharacterised protein [Serratia rubidaea]|uniref:Uncharacterized protein n=1 Tax=Serratia rubidaea TaxID=61652 RepID=A0A3S4WC64_SERRU|nr:Uncharacterised protein [Serratia rubidaea]
MQYNLTGHSLTINVIPGKVVILVKQGYILT